MKTIKIISIIVASLIFNCGATAQVKNKLPRKAIIGAMQNAMQDSTASTLKPFTCKKETKSITIEVTNSSLPQERPYIISADSLGVTLEIFRGSEHVFNEFFRYHGSNFAKIMAKANSAKLKKVKAHGETIVGGMTTILNFNNSKGAYFTLCDNAGVMDYEGDFDGVITEITHQIPNFQAIVCKDYDNPVKTMTLKADEIIVNGETCGLISLTEIGSVLTPNDTTPKCEILISQDEQTFTVSYNSNTEVSLIKMRKFKGKKKEEFYGFSYEDIVKNVIKPASCVEKDGIISNIYKLPESSLGFYVIYDKKANKVVVIKVTYETTVE